MHLIRKGRPPPSPLNSTLLLAGVKTQRVHQRQVVDIGLALYDSIWQATLLSSAMDLS